MKVKINSECQLTKSLKIYLECNRMNELVLHTCFSSVG